jgi:hypothetical protein
MEEVMGPGAIAAPKTAFGRKLDMIGWELDLDRRLVSMSAKNLNKTLFAFFAVNVDEGITLPVLQALASRASRAATLSRAMNNFTREMFGCMQYYHGDRAKTRILSAEAKVEVFMWRAYLVQLLWAPQVFARSLESFRAKAAGSVRIEYDASLSGLGMQLSRWEAGVWKPWAHMGAALPGGEVLGENKSGKQNLCEYLAVIAGLLVLRQQGHRDFTVDLWGDNTTSLAWFRKGKVKSALARRASLGVGLLLAHMGATVGNTVHIPGEENGCMDGLSRGLSSAEVGLPPEQLVPLIHMEWEWKFLLVCSNENGEMSQEGLTSVLGEFVELLRVPPPQRS